MLPKRICLIDDDPIVRDALSLGLSDAGFDVLVAPGAAAALDMMGRNPVDAVVTDMKMPGFDGGALIAALRERWPHLPVVAISGGGEIGGKDVGDIARDQGANTCLVKPFRAADIARALNALLTPSA
jgi:DNA-binding response OmpR family regulator